MDNLAASIKSFWDSLTASAFPSSTRPSLYLTAAPVVTALGAQVNVDTASYVTFTLLADNEEQGFESDIENLNLTFTAYAIGANVAGGIIEAARFNGQAASSYAGFDNRATLPGLTGVSLIGIFPTRPPEIIQERQLSKASAVVFRCVMNYRGEVEGVCARRFPGGRED